jgi:hypothetical protein
VINANKREGIDIRKVKDEVSSNGVNIRIA